MQDVIQDGPKP